MRSQGTSHSGEVRGLRTAGLWLRFIFVYRFNWKKADKAYRADKNSELEKDLTYGKIGFILIIALIFLYQLFMGKLAFL